jgi:TonB family protein
MRVILLVASVLIMAACRYEPPATERVSPKDSEYQRMADLRPPDLPTKIPPAFTAGLLPDDWQKSEAQTPLRVGGDVVAPLPVKRVEPDFRPCQGQPHSGAPILEAVIDERGVVREVRMLRPVNPCIEEAAVDAIRQWQFRPGMLNGRPVPVVFNMVVLIHYSR